MSNPQRDRRNNGEQDEQEYADPHARINERLKALETTTKDLAERVHGNSDKELTENCIERRLSNMDAAKERADEERKQFSKSIEAWKKRGLTAIFGVAALLSKELWDWLWGLKGSKP